MIDSIVPRPDSVLRLDGRFQVVRSTRIAYREPDPGSEPPRRGPVGSVQGIAESLQGSLRPATGLSLPVVPSAFETGAISLSIDPGLPESGYRLDDTSSDGEELLRRRAVERLGEQEPLAHIASRVAKRVQLAVLLDAFGDGAQP